MMGDIFGMLDFDDQQRFDFIQNPVWANCIRPFRDRFQSNILVASRPSSLGCYDLNE
jgi:hypothetical protein